MSSPRSLPLIARAEAHGARTALVAPEGRFSYADLLAVSARAAARLLDGASDLDEARVVFLAPHGLHYMATQWGIWRAGGVAVPLALTETDREIRYKVEDAAPAVIVAHPEFADRLRPVAEEQGIRFLLTGDLLEGGESRLPDIEPSRRAMIIYTSGTTSNPKGAVTTHANITAQVETLVQAWEWSQDDRIHNPLPMHHVHGVINATSCALWAGAICEATPRFNAELVWSRIASGELTVYMAVPTTYKALIAAWDKATPEQQAAMSAGCHNMRLMVSGSDALPVDTFEKWFSISGHRLLERYGMTEVGMALSNPLHGERIPGHVGKPLPGVTVRLVGLDLAKFEETGDRVYGGDVAVDQPGELLIKGPSVFKEYWRKPEATAESFDADGWFYSGDIASINADGVYRIWGRASQDLIISGGENVSAIEVQRELLMHPAIEQCAVVGVKDPFWGKAVSAVVVLRDGQSLDRDSLRSWAKGRLAPYKVPQRLLVVDDLPKNAMGKVVKPKVRAMLDGA